MTENEASKQHVTPEQALALAKEQGIEISDEQLEQISGGWSAGRTYITCVNCGRKVYCESEDRFVYCTGCGHKNGPFKQG